MKHSRPTRVSATLTRGALLAMLVVAPATSEAQTPATVSPSTQQNVATAKESELRIAPGDLLEISVYGAPDYTRQVRVGSSGEISVPLLGVVKVGGLPIGAAERSLAQRLAEGGFFNSPQVSILHKEYSTQGVSVLGEVQKPGIYPLLGRRTLLDAISAAGGTTPKAGTTVTITHRDGSQPAETIKLNFGPHDPPQTEISVLPGDTITVSKAGIVYVVGDVRQPSGIVMENPELTVLQALAMAQGVNPNAALTSARIIRRTENGPQETPINLKRILAAKDPDLKLQPDDVLFVPNSAGKSAVRRSMEAILQTATGIAIYRR